MYMVGVLWGYSCGGGDLRVEQIISTEVIPPAVITAAAAADDVVASGGRYAAKLTWHSAAEMVIRISSPR